MNFHFATLLLVFGSLTGSIAHYLPDSSLLEEGIELYQEDRFQRAVGVLQAAAEVEPSRAEPWTYLGLAQVQIGEPARALMSLRKAIEIDPEIADAHFGLGLAHGYLNQTDLAIDQLKRAIEIDHEHAYAHFHLGLAYNQKGRTDLVLLHLGRFLELAPTAPEARGVRELLDHLR
jgi:tetratricopeptide (TPR) repeat protein